MIPLNDIVDGIGYARSSLHKVVKRNPKQFKRYTCMCVTPTHLGYHDHETLVCLTRDGVIGLLMRLDVEKIPDPEKQNGLLAFQWWAMETLGQVMGGESLTYRPAPPAPVRTTHPFYHTVEEYTMVAKLVISHAGSCLSGHSHRCWLSDSIL